jgi:hypothetical protein
MPSGVYPRKKKFPAISMKQLKTFSHASKPYKYEAVFAEELTTEEMHRIKKMFEFYFELCEDLYGRK